MIEYKCRISDSSGKISDSIRTAESEQALIRQINEDNLYLLFFRENRSGKGKRFSRKVIIDFTDTMALMLQSGLTIRDALKVAATSFKDRKT